MTKQKKEYEAAKDLVAEAFLHHNLDVAGLEITDRKAQFETFIEWMTKTIVAQRREAKIEALKLTMDFWSASHPFGMVRDEIERLEKEQAINA